MDEYDPTPRLTRQLDRIEQLAMDAKQAAERTNGRVLQIEQILDGPTDRHGRHMGGGLRESVEEIRDEVDELSKQTIGMSAADVRAHRDRAVALVGLGLVISGLMLAASVVGLILQ